MFLDELLSQWIRDLWLITAARNLQEKYCNESTVDLKVVCKGKALLVWSLDCTRNSEWADIQGTHTHTHTGPHGQG